MYTLDGYVSPKLMINLEKFSCKVYKVKRTLPSALICLVVMSIACFRSMHVESQGTDQVC